MNNRSRAFARFVHIERDVNHGFLVVDSVFMKLTLSGLVPQNSGKELIKEDHVETCCAQSA